jgi:hypothetical protein
VTAFILALSRIRKPSWRRGRRPMAELDRRKKLEEERFLRRAKSLILHRQRASGVNEGSSMVLIR